MKENIWILNHYATGMHYSSGGRHYWFAKYLKQSGYEPAIFCANTKHGVPERYVDTENLLTVIHDESIDVPFVLVQSSLYSSNGMDRVFNMVNFYRNVQKAAKQYAKEHGQPDIIYASSVHPLTLVAGIRLAKHFGVKCICEVRDLWPESIIVYSNNIKRESLLARIMYAGEHWIYERADALIFTMAGGAEYICSRGWDSAHGGSINLSKIHHISNGVDLEVFDENVTEHWFDDPDMDDAKSFKVVYAGSIRKVNELGMVLDAAKLVVDTSVRFVIFGSGDELETLKRRVKNESIGNVVFKGRIPKNAVPSVDVRADLNLMHSRENSLLKYGTSPNKSFEYFAAGRPVLCTFRPGYSLVESSGCGLLAREYTSQAIAEVIDKISTMSEAERAEMGIRARRVGEQYDFRRLTERLVEVIEEV